MPSGLCLSPSTFICSDFEKVAYCGKECQKQDWKTHKPCVFFLSFSLREHILINFDFSLSKAQAGQGDDAFYDDRGPYS